MKKLIEMDCGTPPEKIDLLFDLMRKSKSLDVLMMLDDANGSLRFTEMKKAIDTSATTLNRRLSELTKANLVSKERNGKGDHPVYTLTEVAKKLSPVMKGMFQWLSEWNPDEGE